VVGITLFSARALRIQELKKCDTHNFGILVLKFSKIWRTAAPQRSQTNKDLQHSTLFIWNNKKQHLIQKQKSTAKILESTQNNETSNKILKLYVYLTGNEIY
jgi:hypothetical protein